MSGFLVEVEHHIQIVPRAWSEQGLLPVAEVRVTADNYR